MRLLIAIMLCLVASLTWAEGEGVCYIVVEKGTVKGGKEGIEYGPSWDLCGKGDLIFMRWRSQVEFIRVMPQVVAQNCEYESIKPFEAGWAKGYFCRYLGAENRRTLKGWPEKMKPFFL